MRLSTITWIVPLLLIVATGCSDDTVTPDAAVVDQSVTSDTATADDTGSADTTQADSGACDYSAMAQEAATSGRKILNGITLQTSTPIADLLANPSQYEGKEVRVEGIIVTICPSAGCYVTIQDKDGNQINLKVQDGVINFQTLAQLGQYAIGEGLFQAVGAHGTQVYINDHGALIGNLVCTP